MHMKAPGLLIAVMFLLSLKSRHSLRERACAEQCGSSSGFCELGGGSVLTGGGTSGWQAHWIWMKTFLQNKKISVFSLPTTPSCPETEGQSIRSQ